MMFMQRDSGGNLIIASHHPKSSVTWSWILVWSKHKGGTFFAAMRTNKYRGNEKRRGLYGFVILGRLRFELQPTLPWKAQGADQ